MNSPAWLIGEFPPIPENEDKRLQALETYLPEDTEPQREEAFDRLAALAAQLCDVPVAFINLIGKEKEFKKACFGFEGQTTPREISFCQFTIMQEDILEVEDTHEDDRFRKNPNVSGELNLRYYAGIPLKNPNGHTIGTLCLIDHQPNKLTPDQKSALQTLAEEIISRFELNAAQNRLEDVNREKDDLIKIVSHDMRNPLIGIIGFAEYLHVKLDDAEHQEILEYIEDAGNSLLGLINLLLNTGYIKNESISVNLIRCDATALAEDVLRMHRPYAQLKNVDLTIEHPPEIYCKLDREKWKQIVGNLAGNAIKFTPAGGTVSIHLSKSGKVPTTIDLTVKDTGIGMPDEIKNNLFSKTDDIRRSGTDGEESTGLGMRIIRKNVELLRGTVSVESVPGKGTSISIRIPV